MNDDSLTLIPFQETVNVPAMQCYVAIVRALGKKDVDENDNVKMATKKSGNDSDRYKSGKRKEVKN